MYLCTFDITYRNTYSPSHGNKCRELLSNKRRKTTTLVWYAFIEFTNEIIAFIYSKDYTASSAQLKKWLASYGYGYEVLAPVMERIEQERNALNKEEQK